MPAVDCCVQLIHSILCTVLWTKYLVTQAVPGTLIGWHPMQVCRCRRPPHPVTFRRSSSTRCGFGAAPAFVCGRPVTGAARPDGGRM